MLLYLLGFYRLNSYIIYCKKPPQVIHNFQELLQKNYLNFNAQQQINNKNDHLIYNVMN